MEEPELYHRSVDGPDVIALLKDGSWKPSKKRSPYNTASSTPIASSPRSSFPGLSATSSYTRPRYMPRSDWPPCPSVEDEKEALAREVSSPHETVDEPPCRGDFEQHPIILEAGGSGDESSKEAPHSANSERRFVLQSHTPSDSEDDELEQGHARTDPREDELEDRKDALHGSQRHEHTKLDRREGSYGNGPTHPDRREDGHDDHRNGHTKPGRREETRPSPRHSHGKPDDRRLGEEPAATLGRKKSRQDLPNLNTKIDPPPFRRTTSAYSYRPPKEESKYSARTPDVQSKEQNYSGTSGRAPLVPPKNDMNHQTRMPNTPRTPDVPLKDEYRYPARKPEVPLKNDVHHQHRNSKTETFLTPGVGRGYPTSYFDNRNGSKSEHSTPRPRTPSDTPKSSAEAKRRPELPRASSSRPPLRSGVDERHHRSSFTSSEDERKSRHGHHRHKSGSLHPDNVYSEYGREGDRHHRSHSKSRSSKSSTPVPSHGVFSDTLHPEVIREHDRHRRSHSKSRSYNSPIPSPKNSPNRYETFPPVRRLSSSGTLSSDSDLSTSPTSPRSKHFRVSRRPTPVPGVDFEYVSVLPDIIPEYHASPVQSFWPPPIHDDKPIGSYRRYSQDTESGAVAPLPPCPRSSFVKGYNDWLTIPGCPSFDICPDCFDASVAKTRYRDQFIPAAPRDNAPILCDFGNSQWHRIAWLVTLHKKLPTINLLTQIASIAAINPPCSDLTSPDKKWYSIPDPKNGYQAIPHFEVCGACVQSIQSILPSLRSAFIPISNRAPKPCSMRFDSRKFVEYFDALETASDVNGEILPKDLATLASAIKHIALQPECYRDFILHAKEWHTLKGLPDFTACGECYEEVVRPLLSRQHPVATAVGKGLREWGSCVLYSEHMRKIFREAVERNDVGALGLALAKRRQVLELRLLRDDRVPVSEAEWRRYE